VSTTRDQPAGASDSDEADRIVPVPDEDGPHDVPDDKVIEKTLPGKPVREGGGS
jgi:hypothetical protein